MADVKISELPASSPAISDEVPVNQSGTTVKVTIEDILALNPPPSGQQNHLAYFNPSGDLTSINSWTVVADYDGLSVALTYEPDPVGTLQTKIINIETEINPVLATTNDTVSVLGLNAHVDRTGSGEQFGNVAGLLNMGLSLEGTGLVGNVVGMNQNVSAGTGSNSGAAGNVTALAFGWNVGTDYTIEDFFGLAGGLNIDPTATVDDVSMINFAISGNNNGNYSSLSFNHGGNIGGSYTGLYLNHFGDANSGIGIDLGVSGAFANNLLGINLNLQGSAPSGFTGVNLGSTIDFTGSNASLANFNNSGTGSSFVGMSTNNTGDIATNLKMISASNSGAAADLEMLFLNNQGLGGNLNIMNILNSGNGDNIKLLDLTNSGVSTGNLTGASISISGQGASVTGININVENATSTGEQKTAISFNGGGINGNYIKPLASAAFFSTSHSIVSLLTTPSAITGTTHICLSLPMVMTATDDFAAGPLGISAAAIGFVGQLGAASGKTIDSVAMAASGFAVDGSSTGGTLTDAVMFLALGALDFGGGPLIITNIYGLRVPSAFGVLADNAWGVSVEDATAENFFKKSLVIGGSSKVATNSSVGLEIQSDTAARFANMTTTTRDGLTALKGMVIYNTTTDKLQAYNGAWADLH